MRVGKRNKGIINVGNNYKNNYNALSLQRGWPIILNDHYQGK